MFPMQCYRLHFIVVFFLVTSAGCFGSLTKPAELPQLHPLTLTITQDGQPLAEAIVSLKPQDDANKWATGGVSDAQGIVKVKTAGNFPGAPEGKYKVTVIKTEMELQGSAMVDISVVDKKLINPTTTTLEVEVTSGKNEVTLDVGKPVRVKVEEITEKVGL
jgi:hypothetical protein